MTGSFRMFPRATTAPSNSLRIGEGGADTAAGGLFTLIAAPPAGLCRRRCEQHPTRRGCSSPDHLIPRGFRLLQASRSALCAGRRRPHSCAGGIRLALRRRLLRGRGDQPISNPHFRRIVGAQTNDLQQPPAALTHLHKASDLRKAPPDVGVAIQRAFHRLAAGSSTAFAVTSWFQRPTDRARRGC